MMFIFSILQCIVEKCDRSKHDMKTPQHFNWVHYHSYTTVTTAPKLLYVIVCIVMVNTRKLLECNDLHIPHIITTDSGLIDVIYTTMYTTGQCSFRNQFCDLYTQVGTWCISLLECAILCVDALIRFHFPFSWFPK